MSWPANPSTPLELAGLSPELGINDPQRAAETLTEDGKRGALSGRNTEAPLRAPFPVSAGASTLARPNSSLPHISPLRPVLAPEIGRERGKVDLGGRARGNVGRWTVNRYSTR